MGFTKDLWTAPERDDKGAVVRDDKGRPRRIPNGRWGTGKRWLSCWLDPDGRERTKAFTGKVAADRYWRDKESERDRGEYVDPKAGRELVSELARRWLNSAAVDPKSLEVYERVWRLRIEPVFGKRTIKSMTRPSEILSFLTDVKAKFSDSQVGLARLVLGGMLELAVADGDLRRNPVRNKIVSTGKTPSEQIAVWSDTTVWALIDAHPPALRALPITMATTGCREGEAYALALEDIDFDRGVMHVRRQIKLLAKTWCYALPKNDQERVVPLAASTAETLRTHVANYPPAPVTLPWERPDGERRTHRLVFLHPDSRCHMTYGVYIALWRPALAAAGLIPQPPPRRDGKPSKRYQVAGSKKLGRHQLRHYYANLQLTGGTNIRELADYLGHADPAFTLRVYGHLQPDSHERARQAVDSLFFRPRAVSDGT